MNPFFQRSPDEKWSSSIAFKFVIALMIEIALMAFLTVMFNRNIHLQNNLIGFERDRTAMLRTAHELQNSSNDLTRFARTYVVTGNDRYLEKYNRVLGIRNGLLPRPEGYNGVYWDYIEPQKHHPDGQAIALDTIIDRLPYTDEERSQIVLSHNNSDELVHLEREAFDAMRGKFHNEAGETFYTSPDQKLAISLLFTQPYHLAKEKIMEPIDRFYRMLEERTAKQSQELEIQLRFNERILKVGILFFVLYNIILAIFFHIEIVHVIRKMIVHLQTRPSSPMTIDIAHSNELSLLQRSYNSHIETITRHEINIRRQKEEIEQFNDILRQRIHDEVEKSTHQQKLLIQQSKMAEMGEMIGNIAHQWRQPLSILGLIVQDMEEAYTFNQLDETYLHDAVEKAMIQIQFMSKTIDDFRSFFRPEKEKRLFDLKQTLREAVNMIAPVLEKGGIRIEIIEEASGTMNIMGYSNEFKQVLINLLTNAKDAFLSGKVPENVAAKITLTLRETDQYYSLAVCDNAGGIPETILDRIFNPYFTTKEEGKGTGIGLYMSKMIIEENMEGELQVHNTETGACFTILLNRFENRANG
ncbi:MAG: ATP-binding protein [Sulfuricurvum sp.]